VCSCSALGDLAHICCWSKLEMPLAVIAHKEGPFEDCTLESVPALQPHEGTAIVNVLSGRKLWGIRGFT
jgi:hypothetical protein